MIQYISSFIIQFILVQFVGLVELLAKSILHRLHKLVLTFVLGWVICFWYSVVNCLAPGHVHLLLVEHLLITKAYHNLSWNLLSVSIPYQTSSQFWFVHFFRSRHPMALRIYQQRWTTTLLKLLIQPLIKSIYIGLGYLSTLMLPLLLKNHTVSFAQMPKTGKTIATASLHRLWCSPGENVALEVHYDVVNEEISLRPMVD